MPNYTDSTLLDRLRSDSANTPIADWVSQSFENIHVTYDGRTRYDPATNNIYIKENSSSPLADFVHEFSHRLNNVEHQAALDSILSGSDLATVQLALAAEIRMNEAKADATAIFYLGQANLLNTLGLGSGYINIIDAIQLYNDCKAQSGFVPNTPTGANAMMACLVTGANQKLTENIETRTEEYTGLLGKWKQDHGMTPLPPPPEGGGGGTSEPQPPLPPSPPTPPPPPPPPPPNGSLTPVADPTPAPPPGGGGGGGGCVACDSFLPDGRRAGDVAVGDALILADGSSLTASAGVVTYSAKKVEAGYRITTQSGITLCCSKSAPIPTPEGLVLAPQLLGRKVPTQRVEGGETITRWETVEVVDFIGDLQVQHITVGDKCFWAGENSGAYILHHNLKPDPGEGELNGLAPHASSSDANFWESSQPENLLRTGFRTSTEHAANSLVNEMASFTNTSSPSGFLPQTSTRLEGTGITMPLA